MSEADEHGRGASEARQHQQCPRCKDDMLRMYRQRSGTDRWDHVWLCLTCRFEVVIPDEG